MDKKKQPYVELEMETIAIEAEDVITTSNPAGNNAMDITLTID